MAAVKFCVKLTVSFFVEMLDRIKSGRETLPVEQALLVLLVSLPTCCCYRLLAFGSVWGCCHDT